MNKGNSSNRCAKVINQLRGKKMKEGIVAVNNLKLLNYTSLDACE